MQTGRIVFGLISVVFLVTAIGCYVLQSQNEDITQNTQRANIADSKNLFNILILGLDFLEPEAQVSEKRWKWGGRSDFMVVVCINPPKRKVFVISIPRDTKIDIDNKHKGSRINAANAVGGQKMAKKTVEKLLGLAINRIVVFSIPGFINLFNEFGPVTIHVPKKMSYHDNTAGLHIEIEKGLQEMNGQILMNFLRYRSDEMGDIGRIKRQHMFFDAIFKELGTNPEIVFKLPTLFNKANKVFLTDMSFQEMFSIGLLLKSLPGENFTHQILPGYFGDSGSWKVDKDQLKELIKVINGKDT